MFKNINILRPILAILILFIPLYPKFPLTFLNGAYVAIRLDDIIIALAVAIWIVYQFKHGFPVLKSKIVLLPLAYFIAITLSTLVAILIYQIDSPSILLLNYFRRFEYMSLFFITLDAIKSKKDLSYPFAFLIAATIFVSLYGYGQKYLKFPVISTMNAEFSKGQLLQADFWTRISSTFAGHYDLAGYLSLALIIIFCLGLYLKNRWYKIGLLILWLGFFPILSFTASRVSIFAYWGGIVFTLLLLRRYFWIIPISLLVIFSIFNSKDLNRRLLATIPAIRSQLFRTSPASPNQPQTTPTTAVPTPVITKVPGGTTAITTPVPTVIRHPAEQPNPIDVDAGVARSGEIRFNAEWPRAINAFRKNIILGTGLGSITLATDNDYLRALGESGILGFLTLGIFLGYFVIRSIPFIFSRHPDRHIIIIFLGSLLTFLANATLIDVFEASKTAYLFWIMMAVYYRCLEFFSQNKSS